VCAYKNFGSEVNEHWILYALSTSSQSFCEQWSKHELFYYAIITDMHVIVYISGFAHISWDSFMFILLARISALPAIWCALVVLNLCDLPKFGREGTHGCYQSFDMALCVQCKQIWIMACAHLVRLHQIYLWGFSMCWCSCTCTIQKFLTNKTSRKKIWFGASWL